MNNQHISTSSQASGASPSPASEQDTRQLSLLKTTPTHKQSCESTGPTSLSTTTSEPSTLPHHLDYLRQECLVSLHRAPGRCVEVLTSTTGCSGRRSLESSAKQDPSTQSWRTQQVCFQWTEAEPSQESYLNFTPSGMIYGGKLWELTQLVRGTEGKDSGSLLPTPSGVNGGTNHTAGRLDEWGGSSNPFRGTKYQRVRCAAFEEWMMGLDIHHTALTPSETPSSRKSLK